MKKANPAADRFIQRLSLLIAENEEEITRLIHLHQHCVAIYRKIQHATDIASIKKKHSYLKSIDHLEAEIQKREERNQRLKEKVNYQQLYGKYK